MKVILTAINAKYIHTNIALRYFKKLCANIENCHIILKEFTINQSPELILREIMIHNPDAVALSTYIWNIDIVEKLAENIRIISPNIKIILGGPEVSYISTPIFPYDYIIKGEGEIAMQTLLQDLSKGISPPEKTIIGKSIDINLLPFPYDMDKEDLTNKIIYYEASRGCPFNCSYCLSSATNGVRYKNIETIKSELLIFIENKVRQVKLTDRTFNADKKLFLEIISFLNKSDNGYTNFHFEVAAELFDEESLSLISTLRKGLIQMEIGVQSTNTSTLKSINRSTNLEKLFLNVDRIMNMGNIHLHLDLIAGLPYETLHSFKNSFNDVYSHKPHQLQLGFLKLLKGSTLYSQALQYDIKFRPYPPYEVLSTIYINYAEYLKLKTVEEMVDLYYNSGRYDAIITFFSKGFQTAFDMFLSLGEKYIEKSHHLVPLSGNGHYDFLYEFGCEHLPSEKHILPELCRYDILCHNPPNKLPSWAYERPLILRDLQLDFLKSSHNIKKYLPHMENTPPKEILRYIYMEEFTQEYITDNYGAGNQVLLFDYTLRDLDGKAKCMAIVL